LQRSDAAQTRPAILFLSDAIVAGGIRMRKTQGLALLWLASTALTGTALAQAAPAEEPAATDHSAAPVSEADIVVTAQRREQRLIDVPIAVSAVSTASLERAGVQNLNNIQAIIPNLQINQTPGNGFSPLISIRGLAPSADTSLARDQPVGLYLDGVPIAKSTGAAFDTVDLERVEVLRGPQGTLYGKNTIGGAVNLITRAPTGEFGGQIWLSYGEWNRFQRRVSVDLPAVGDFKIKFGYSGNDMGGYWHNAATHRDFGSQSLNAGRIDVLWEPSSRFSARYVYDISHGEGKPTLLAVSAIGATFPASLRPLVADAVFSERPGRNDVAAQSALQSDFETTGHSLTLSWNLGEGSLGDVTLRSITARRTMRSRSQSDFDGAPADLIRFILNNDYKAVSQEFQIIGTGNTIKYTLGAFYLKDDYSVYNPRWNFQFGGNRYDLSDRGGGNRSMAGYGQLTWTPEFAARKLDVSAGLRYTSDRKHAYELFLGNSTYAANPKAPLAGVFERAADGTPITRSGQPPAGARPGAGGIGPYDLLPLERSDKWSQFNPEFNLVYRLQPDWSAYARVATGFKSGGINDTASTNAAFNAPYDPEHLLSFEVGTKFSSPNRVFNVNLSLYHSIYKDFQAGVFVPELITTNIVNAGEAKFTGVEIEGSVRPFNGLVINFGGGYLDARYTDFVLPSGQDVTATYRIPLAPKWNYLVGGVYRVPMGGATLEASANWSWRSMQWATISPDTLATRKAYGTLDARLGLTDIHLGNGTTLELAVWGRNLTDTKYWNGGLNLGVLALRQWADPRSVGVEGRVRF
jgi:iron complex outermembrane receptor protein